MEAFFLCIATGVAGGILSLILRPKRLQTVFGAGGAIASSLLGIYVAQRALLGGSSLSWRSSWTVPFGSFSLDIDSLSAFFLIPLFILALCGALYAIEYLRDYKPGGNPGIQWFFYNLLVASMAMVAAASNGLLFLLAWEMMSLSSFALVMLKHEERESREAAWIYLISTHIGSAFLLVFFVFAGSQADSLNFDAIAAYRFPALSSAVLFTAALIGFGAKAGFVPFHVWLPRAHPAAPSHVSALMSGIMIKMGIYGILRSLTLLGEFQSWWGITLVAIGCVSGVLGVLLALGQHDLKRLLAYHSVENIGIIALGIGAGILGSCYNLSLLAVLGFCGALLHVVNHAFFKGLLFLGAGAVLHATGTAQIDRLGGLIKKMPSTAACFLVGSIAICGLPPLNGFVSEFLIFIAGFHGLQAAPVQLFVASACLAASLALIGGLAAACFTKAFGTVFLGEPRSPLPPCHDVGPWMKAPMYALCGACFCVGLFFWFLAPALAGPAAIVARVPHADAARILGSLVPGLTGISIGGGGLLAAAVFVLALRKRLLKKRIVSGAPTWDCGYVAPNPRMQYTASSFAQPILSFFKPCLLPKQEVRASAAAFPTGWKFHSHVPDLFYDRFYVPLFKGIGWLLARLRWLQGGKIHSYVLYIALTLIALLFWNFVWNK